MSEKCDIHVPKVQELWFQMKMNNLKHSGSKEDDQEMAAKRKAMVLSFQPVSLTFDYVNYYVEMPANEKTTSVSFSTCNFCCNHGRLIDRSAPKRSVFRGCDELSPDRFLAWHNQRMTSVRFSTCNLFEAMAV
ncbi:hypothetical protein Hdeb2414_s0001g00013521 [Helianthus debilis subsp. tardiflorus]